MFKVRNPYSSEESDEDSLSPSMLRKDTNVVKDDNVQIEHLRLKELSTPCNVLIIGPKHSGKTLVIQNILTLPKY